ncbi:MAG: ABC transporter permease [Gemmatimonadaceae bacterium]
MRKLWAIIKREYLERVRTRWFVVATVFGPLLFAVVTALPAYLSAKSTASAGVANIVILDVTGADLGVRVAAALRDRLTPAQGGALTTTPTHVEVVSRDRLAAAESTATHAVMRGDTQGYLVLDHWTAAGETARYAGRNATSLPDMQRLQGAVRSAVMAFQLEREGLDARRVQSLVSSHLAVKADRLSERGRGGSGTVNTVFALAVALLLYMSIILYGQAVLRGVMEEKTTRVAEVVVASVPADTLLAGKVIGVGAVGITQQLIWITSALALLKIRAPLMVRLGIPTTPLELPHLSIGAGLLLLVFFVLGFIFYGSLFAAVGATVNNPEDAQQAATPVILLLVLSVIFVQPVALNPGGTLSAVMSRLPFSAPIIMPLRMSLVQVDAGELALVLGGITLACIGAVWFAARVYRVGLLMYGKRPTLAEIVRWVRLAG